MPYVDFSMSVNAVVAYDCGLVPASKVPGVPTELVRKFCKAAEWHHTSCRFNATDFYDPCKVRAMFGVEPDDEWETIPAAVAALAAWKSQKKQPPKKEIFHGCAVDFLEWGGTRNFPKCYEMHEENCTVEIRGATAYVTDKAGKKVTTKRMTTRGFSFSKGKPI